MPKFATAAERAAQTCAVAATFVFFVSGVVYLYQGRWTVTHGDYWGIYEFCFNHTWLESALPKFNWHSLFFPSFLWLIDLRFFHGDQLPLFLAGFVLLLVTVGLLLVPVWRDNTVGLTAKIMSTLVVIVGNFWMGRAVITASGGFNCMCSLVMIGAVVAFLLLPAIRAGSPRRLPATLIVICAGFVASFSFGTGLAIWPTLLVLGWGLRLPKYSLGILAAAGLMAALIFILLPDYHWVSQEALPPLPSVSSVTVIWLDRLLPSVSYFRIIGLCRLLGSPFSFALFSWWPDKSFRPLVESSEVAVAVGAAGLILAILATLSKIIRRDMQKSRLEFTGLGLIVFNLVALLLVVAGRPGRELSSSRFFFWSTLFWTGLFLVAIARADSRRWLHWPVYLIALALPVLVFARHFKEGAYWRNKRRNAESAATSLVNGVHDRQIIGVVSLGGFGPEWIYRVAEQMRARRLDMFADGLQDWIGLSEADLFGGRHKPDGLTGRCHVAALTQCDNGAPAAQVIGQVSREGNSLPERLVIVDPTGVVCGVARFSAPISPFINRTFYLGKFTSNWFVGYIRGYDPQLAYAVRSADDGVFSEDKIPVRPQITKPPNP